MPFYRITITDIYGHISQGVREDPISNIDVYYQKARQKAITAFRSNFKDIDVVMLTTGCAEVQKHLQKKMKGTNLYIPPGELKGR